MLCKYPIYSFERRLRISAQNGREPKKLKGRGAQTQTSKYGILGVVSCYFTVMYIILFTRFVVNELVFIPLYIWKLVICILYCKALKYHNLYTTKCIRFYFSAERHLFQSVAQNFLGWNTFCLCKHVPTCHIERIFLDVSPPNPPTNTFLVLV